MIGDCARQIAARAFFVQMVAIYLCILRDLLSKYSIVMLRLKVRFW